MTPKFVQIQATCKPASLFTTAEVYLFGLTANGNVYEWSGHEWELLDNHEDDPYRDEQKAALQKRS